MTRGKHRAEYQRLMFHVKLRGMINQIAYHLHKRRSTK